MLTAVCHVWASAHWFDVWADILGTISRANVPSPLRLGMVGDEYALFEAVSLAGAYGVHVVPVLHAQNHETTDTLHLAWQAAQQEDKPVLFCHTKGIFNPSPTKTRWRWMMLERVVAQWKDRLEDLKKGWDIVGCCWHPGKRWLAGNFWVATAAYLRRLPPPVWTGNRWDNEWWPLRASPAPRVLSLVDQFCEPCLPEFYVTRGNPWKPHGLPQT